VRRIKLQVRLKTKHAHLVVRVFGPSSCLGRPRPGKWLGAVLGLISTSSAAASVAVLLFLASLHAAHLGSRGSDCGWQADQRVVAAEARVPMLEAAAKQAHACAVSEAAARELL
jgi:hypothetical protein